MYPHKSKTELITEIQMLRQALEQSAPNAYKLLQQCDDLALINRINTAVIQQKPMASVFEMLSRSIRGTFHNNGVAVYLLKNDGQTLEMQSNTMPQKVSRTIEKLLSIKIPKITIKKTSDSYYFNALNSKKFIQINDSDNIIRLISEFTDNHNIQRHIPYIKKILGINHVLLFPLVSGDSGLGIVDISKKTPFTDSEIERLKIIISQINEAILYYYAVLEKEKLLHELQETYNKLKKLSGLIPICSHCKKIRDDSGYWNQVEKYISEHSGAVFSHGICPDCLKNFYPEFVSKKNKLSG